MASMIFDVASDGIAKGSIDWEGDTDIRVMLLSGNGVPDKANATVSAVLGESDVSELSATNYARQTMANKSITTTGGKTLFDADNVDFTDIGGASNDEATGALIYKGTTDPQDDSTNIPIAYIAFTTPRTTNGGTLTFTKHSTDKFFYLDNTGS